MDAQCPAFLATLPDQKPKLLLLGGKGGVGKTTVAAASALHIAAHRPGATVLIISTDPAHSLSDSFDQPIGDRLTPIRGWPNLVAWEMDAQRVYWDFMAQYGEVLKNIVDRGTYFDREDISDFLALALPGQDEMMALRAMAKVVRCEEYAVIVVDTAPTGHTLRLLSLPQTLSQWLHVLELMHRKHRYVVSRLVGRYRRDDVDTFLEEMVGDLRAIQSILSDPRSTEFVPVTIPEAMSIGETQRLLEGLEGLRVPVRTIVVNRVARNEACPFCRARTQGQEYGLKEIQEKFSSCTLVSVPLMAHEVRGEPRLREFERHLLGERLPSSPVPLEPAGPVYLADGPRPVLPEKELMLFGGKGGVGKTTMAAATALHAATSHPTERTLLFSIDPAHSLSDSLGTPIGDEVTRVAGVEGLFALEMDAPRLLEEFKEKYVEELDEVWESFFRGSGTNIVFDREITEELVNATPPGVDELMALMKVMDFMSEGRFDRYILDLAPTGHALRFLETPDLMREWFRVFFKIILKYRRTMGRRLDHTAELLLEKSKQLRLVKELLTDPRRCRFVTVTMAEAMAVQETRRLVQRLEELSVTCGPMVVNMVVPRTDCSFCRAVRDEQEQQLNALRGFNLGRITVPLFPGQIRGLRSLLEVASAVYPGGNDLYQEESAPVGATEAAGGQGRRHIPANGREKSHARI